MVYQKREVTSASSTTVVLVAVLLGLGEVADGAAEVVLLHAQEAHARRHAAVVRILFENRGEAILRLVELVRVEGGKGGALGRRAGDAGVHLRQLAFVFFQAAGEFGVLWMVLEILAQFLGRSWVGRIPDQRLAQGGLRDRVLGMLLEDADAFGAGSWLRR